MAVVKKISELVPKGSALANTDLLIVGVDNGTDYDLKSLTGAQVLGNVANGLVPYTGATTNVNLGEFEVKAGQVSLDTTPTGTATVTTTRWNDSLGISETTLKGGEVVLKNGVDLVARVVNKVTPNTTLTKANYQVVRISGAQGQRLAVNLAQANNDNNSADTLGIVCETIATNAEGFIMTMGQLENINTTGILQSETWVDGDVLYLSPTTAGKITNIKPTGSTGHIVILGYVEYAHSVNGKIYVKVMNGWELEELHNVSISNPLDKQILSYENSTSLWKNKSVTTGDISDSTNKRYVTDANLTVIGNTSGTNTGDQDLSNLAPKSNPTFTGLTTLDTLKVTTGNYITPVDVVGIDVTGNVNRVSASNGRTALGLGTLATQNGTFSGTSSGTNTGDQIISDATISLTDITTNNFDTTKHGFVPKGTNTGKFLKDDGTWGTPASGSSSGIWGISNASGVYTYYATYQLAVAVATAGQTIEMFGSQTESVADHILKNGVNINYNGYTLTFSSGFGIIDNSVACEVQLLNGEIKKGVATQRAVYITNSSTILRGNVLINSSLAGGGGTGSYGYVGRGKIYGLNFKGNDCLTLSISGDSLGEAYVITVNCTSGVALNSGAVLFGSIINSTSTSVTISSFSLIANCTIRSSGGISVSGTTRMANCSIVNLTSPIISGDPNLMSVENCYLDARASYVYTFGGGVADLTSSVLIDCTLRSGTQYVNGYGSVGNLINCTIITEASVCLANAVGIYNSTKFYPKLNTASGHCITYPNTGNKYIGCHFEPRNASAVALWSEGAPTVYATNNTIARTTTFKTAGIVNGQTNTADAQGNIILN